MTRQAAKVISVSLNSAIDVGIEVRDFAIGSHQVGKPVFRRAAGKAVNVARVLDTLAIPVTLTGFVGEPDQEFFEQELIQTNLACQLFSVPGRTRENITIMDPVSRIDTHIRSTGYRINANDVSRLRKKLALVSKPGVWVVFSGSLPPGMDNENIIEMIQICQMQGASVAVDSGGTVLRACRGLKLDLIKPNLLEVGELFNRPNFAEGDVLNAADKLRDVSHTSIVSCGPDGGYFISDDGIWRGHVPIGAEHVQNTVGCGDAMLAGFLAGRLEGRTPDDAYRFALAVATSAATSLLPAEIDLVQIQRFYHHATITQIT